MIRHFLRLLAKHGYTATSIKKIAESCDTSVGHVLYYFPKKEDLVAAVYEESFKSSNIILEPLDPYCDQLSYLFLRHLLWFYLASINSVIRRCITELSKVHNNMEIRINPLYRRACEAFFEQDIPFKASSAYIASTCSIYSVCAVLERQRKILDNYDYIRIFRVMAQSFFAHVDYPDHEKYIQSMIDLFESQDKEKLYEMHIEYWLQLEE